MRRLVASAALVAPLLAAQAAPQSAHEPILPPAGERGLFGTVADKVASGGTELLSQGGQIVTHVRDGATNLVDSAMNFLGVRYKLGGTSAETGFDCSGFTRYVFENSIGHILPHRANEQANDPNLAKVDRKDLKPGDLVFFDTMRRTFSHVGIYLGDGKFIHAPRTGESVRIEDINISYWARRFTGARRVPELANADGANSTDGLLSRLRERLSGRAVVDATAAAGSGPAPLSALSAAVVAALATSTPTLREAPALPAAAPVAVAGFAPRHDGSLRPLLDR